MRKLFLVMAALLLLDVIAQFYFAGVGTFHAPDEHAGFGLHVFNAFVLQGLALLTALAAGLARAGWGTVVLALLPALLKELQYGIFALADLFVPAGTPRDADGLPLVVEGPSNFVIALHVVNALVILAVSVIVLLRAWRLARRPRTEAATAPPAPVAGS